MQEIIDDFYTAVENYMHKIVEEKDAKYYANNIHVSGLDNCPRQVVYEYFNFPKRKRTLAELITLNVGTYLHTVIDKALKESPEFDVIHNEKKMNRGLPKMFTGKCDNVIVHKKSGKKILQDTKSVRPNAFKYFNNLVKESYKKQLNSYLYGLENMGIDIDLLLITIFDRGGSNTPYITDVEKRDKFEMEDLFALYSNAVINYRDNKQLPSMLDPIFDKDKFWQCGYCLYQGITCLQILEEKKKK